MKLQFFLLMAFLNITKTTQAQTIGQAFYAIENKTFPCEKSLQVFEGVKNPALMFLWGTFGDDLSCVEKFLKMNKKEKKVYIHFSNECCRRNGTCKKGELMKNVGVKELNSRLEKKDKDTLGKYKKRMEEILSFIDEMQKENPNTTWYISTGLEDNYTLKAKKIVYNKLREYKKKSKNSDKITIYVNPLNSKCIANKCEIHKKDLGRDNHWVFLPDGYCVKPFDACNNNVFTASEQNKKINAQIKNKNSYFVWWSEQQGRYGEPASMAKPPRKRTIKISDKQIQEANKLLKKGN